MKQAYINMIHICRGNDDLDHLIDIINRDQQVEDSMRNFLLGYAAAFRKFIPLITTIKAQHADNPSIINTAILSGIPDGTL